MENDIVCHEIVRIPSYRSNIFSTQIFQELLYIPCRLAQRPWTARCRTVPHPGMLLRRKRGKRRMDEERIQMVVDYTYCISRRNFFFCKQLRVL
jgi:hypothetical protein